MLIFNRMKQIIYPVVFLISVAILSGCSGKTYVQKSPDADFSGFSTYAFLPRADSTSNPLFNNDIIDDLIEKSVINEMSKRGYVVETSAPDVMIRFHVIVEERQQQIVNSPSYAYPGIWAGYPLRQPYIFYGGPIYNAAQIVHYEEGTLIIDVVQKSTGKMIWRGWIVGDVDNAEEFEIKIPGMVKRIFEKYPGTRVVKVKEDRI